jgi:hypothetical protein
MKSIEETHVMTKQQVLLAKLQQYVNSLEYIDAEEFVDMYARKKKTKANI